MLPSDVADTSAMRACLDSRADFEGNQSIGAGRRVSGSGVGVNNIGIATGPACEDSQADVQCNQSIGIGRGADEVESITTVLGRACADSQSDVRCNQSIGTRRSADVGELDVQKTSVDMFSADRRNCGVRWEQSTGTDSSPEDRNQSLSAKNASAAFIQCMGPSLFVFRE